ncbi:AEC family transporter [Candidatus Omnitrophota bacterium]
MFSRIAAIFLIILVGTLARWRKILNQETTDGLCRIALEVTLPFLYFHVLATNLTKELFLSVITLPLFAVALLAASFGLSYLSCRHLKLAPEQRRTFMFLVTFPNYGFLAIPIIFALFGQEGLVWVFMFNLGITFVYWTFGVALLAGPQQRGWKIFKNLLNKSTIALVLGLIVGVSALGVPQFILGAADLIGAATIPLALIVVGSILAHREPDKAINARVMITLVVSRLIVLPALALLLINCCTDLPQLLRAIIILQAAMPAASTTPILTKRFGGDAHLAAQGVFFTTLVSIITVPLFISLALR